MLFLTVDAYCKQIKRGQVYTTPDTEGAGSTLEPLARERVMEAIEREIVAAESLKTLSRVFSVSKD
jgi:dsDNA-specific endonuclease/ATPase MutS2